MINGGLQCQAVPLCEVCGSAGEVVHANLEDRLFGSPGRWSTRRCGNRRCRLGWLDPRPETEELARLYANYFTHVSHGDGGAADFRSKGARRLVKQLLGLALWWRRSAFRSDNLYLEGMAPSRLLGIGCGNGAFLASMKAQGWDAAGLDFDGQAVAAARAAHGVDARVGDLLTAALAPASFDAVVLNNVLEHLPDPARVFAECRRITRPGGRVVMITPNFDSEGQQLFGPDWRGLEVPRHLLLFTTPALKRLAKAAGFARAAVFSPAICTRSTRFIVDKSGEIARAAGRAPAPAQPAAMARRAFANMLAGRNTGEWIVLVAQP